jgi:CheY-like chemotaxis protein
MKQRILIVEDQEDNRRILRDLLSKAGFELLEATTGQEGVRLAEVNRPDLILMDVQMPVLDGHEATRRIKRQPPSSARFDHRNHLHGAERRRRWAAAAGARDAYGNKPSVRVRFLPPSGGSYLSLAGQSVMRSPPIILIVDDNAANIDISRTRLASQGYSIITAADGQEALCSAQENLPDLILLDVMMPKLNGIEVTRRLKGDPSIPFMPIILVTARTDVKDIVAGLDAGADDYLTKPLDHSALVARVRSILRIKALHTLSRRSARVRSLNATRAAGGGTERDRALRTSRRFLAPQLVQMIVAAGDETIFESHRREVVVLFCDLRGFTAFSETTEPEEVMAVLHLS